MKKQFIHEFVTNDINLFCKKVAITRNWYTHPSTKKSEYLIDHNEIGIYSRAIKFLVHCFILLELGVDENFLIKKIKILNEIRPACEYIDLNKSGSSKKVGG